MTESNNDTNETLSRIEQCFMRSVGTRLQRLEESQKKRPLEVEDEGEISKNQGWEEEGGFMEGRKSSKSSLLLLNRKSNKYNLY